MNKAISPSKVGIQVIREKFEEMNNNKSIDTADYQKFQESMENGNQAKERKRNNI